MERALVMIRFQDYFQLSLGPFRVLREAWGIVATCFCFAIAQPDPVQNRGEITPGTNLTGQLRRTGNLSLTQNLRICGVHILRRRINPLRLPTPAGACEENRPSGRRQTFV